MVFTRRWTAFALVVATALCGPWATNAQANGWEHTSIPFDVLIEALEFDMPETRRRAAQSLGVRGQPTAVGPLTKALARPEADPDVRADIYLALGRIGDPSSIKIVTRCLAEESQPRVRGSCATALGGLRGEAALAALITQLQQDQSEQVRARAVESLGQFDDEKAVNALRDVLTGSDTQMRLRALYALGATGAQSAASVLLNVLPRSTDPRERLVTVRALATLGAAEAAPVLKAELRGETDPTMRVALVIALGASRNDDVFEVLVSLLGDPDAAVRYHAVQGLRMLGRTDAAGPVAALALEQARWLESSQDQAIVDHPTHSMGHLTLLNAALRACIELGAEAALDAMVSAAGARSIPRGSAVGLQVAEAVYEVRRLALYGLGYTNSRRAAEILSGAAGIEDPDPRLRATAVRSLGVLSYPELAARVLPMLTDVSAEVRWTSAMVLGRLGERSAGQSLARALGDTNAEVRRQSALGIGYLGYRPAAGALNRLAATDPDPRVREAANFAASLLRG